LKLLDKFRSIAPARADLAGGTLDLWPLYCLVPGSATLNVALDLFASADFEVWENPHFILELKSGKEAYSLNRLEGVDFLNQAPLSLRFPLFVVRELLKQQEVLPSISLKIQFSSPVPVGSGLGGSSTLLVALARGLCRVCSDYLEQGWQWRFLSWAKDTEASFLKLPTGTQDYLAAIFGGLHGYRFQFGAIQQTHYSQKVFKELNERILIVFSGEKHHSGLSNWEVYQRAIAADPKVLNGLERIAGVASFLDKALREEKVDWNQVGKLLSEEWRIRKETFSVSTPQLDQMVSQIENAGILGVKVCGAAQGGSLLALVSPENKASVLLALQKYKLNILPCQATQTGVSLHDSSYDPD